MATAVDHDVRVEHRQAATRWSFLLPVIFGVFAFGAPTFSRGWALVVAGGCVLAFVAHGLFRARHGYVSRAATALYSTFQVDLMCLFATVFAWRVTRSSAWVLLAFAALVVAAAAVGLLWRRVVLQELFAPRTRVGAIVAAVVGGGAAAGGALGFAIGRSSGGWAVGGAVLVVACYAALARQALWLKVEEPDWHPRPAR